MTKKDERGKSMQNIGAVRWQPMDHVWESFQREGMV